SRGDLDEHGPARPGTAARCNSTLFPVNGYSAASDCRFAAKARVPRSVAYAGRGRALPMGRASHASPRALYLARHLYREPAEKPFRLALGANRSGRRRHEAPSLRRTGAIAQTRAAREARPKNPRPLATLAKA